MLHGATRIAAGSRDGGEASIARDATALRAKALKRFAELADPKATGAPAANDSPSQRTHGNQARAIHAGLERAVELITTREDHQRGDDGFAPYRHLAVHVLALALRDLWNPAASPTDRESARRFLTGSPMLAHWCRVASLDPGLLARHAAGADLGVSVRRYQP